MAIRTSKGYFEPKNPQKYQGKRPITYRSSWELAVMRFLDSHESILVWMSESVQIPYFNPFKRAQSVYIPDFIVVYIDKSGKNHAEMMEVKPLKETPGHVPISTRTGKALKVTQEVKLVQALNAIKWQAAQAYCRRHGMTFRVLTEQTLFNLNKK